MSEPPLPLLPRTAPVIEQRPGTGNRTTVAPSTVLPASQASEVRVREDEKRGPALLLGQLHDERVGAGRAAACPAVDASPARATTRPRQFR